MKLELSRLANLAADWMGLTLPAKSTTPVLKKGLVPTAIIDGRNALVEQGVEVKCVYRENFGKKTLDLDFEGCRLPALIVNRELIRNLEKVARENEIDVHKLSWSGQIDMSINAIALLKSKGFSFEFKERSIDVSFPSDYDHDRLYEKILADHKPLILLANACECFGIELHAKNLALSVDVYLTGIGLKSSLFTRPQAQPA